jgi:hypothetical protein
MPTTSGAYSTVHHPVGNVIQLGDLAVCASQLATSAACGPGDSGNSGGGARGGGGRQTPSPTKPGVRVQTRVRPRARVPESESKEESDWLWTQESESTGESDRVWTQEPESTEESDFFLPKSPSPRKSPIPLDLRARWTQESGSKKIGLCVLPWYDPPLWAIRMQSTSKLGCRMSNGAGERRNGALFDLLPASFWPFSPPFWK